MTYAIIGSGAIGTAIARQFVRIRKAVYVASNLGPGSIAPLVSELGSEIIPSEMDRALEADVVILAIPFEAVPTALSGISDWKGRVIVDATNALNPNDFSPLDLGGRPSSQVVADAAPGACVVKAFNHNWARVLGREPQDGKGGHRVLFLSGDHSEANAIVSGLMTEMGFIPIDLGRLDKGGLLQQFGGPLTTHSLMSQAQGGASFPEMDLIDP